MNSRLRTARSLVFAACTLAVAVPSLAGCAERPGKKTKDDKKDAKKGDKKDAKKDAKKDDKKDDKKDAKKDDKKPAEKDDKKPE